ncbi:MAG: hypothetical protein KDA32_04405 [Phycisphaerales bacterium]|nr:hypothetical protein [Phycisphaerales bacterium]
MAAAVLIAGGLSAAVAQEDPKFSVAVSAERTALAPGYSTDLLIELTVQPEWHLYHPVIIGSGLPTALRFETPTGVHIENLRFPKPEFGQVGSDQYLSIPNPTIVLATVRVDADVKPDRTATILVHANGLACKEACLPVQADGRITLPVSAQIGDIEANRAAMFKHASEALPKPLKDADYLKGSNIRVEPTSIEPGKSGEIIVTFKVQDKHHIQANKPFGDMFVATSLWVEGDPALEFDLADQKWPEPKVHEVEYVGKVAEYAGTIEARQPFTVSEDATPGPRSLRVLIQYQTCNEEGQCYPPEIVESRARFSIGPAGLATTSDADIADSVQNESLWDAGDTVPEPAIATPASSEAPTSLLLAILLGLAGGFVLNLMPCVLPVISIKIVGFVQQSGEDYGRVLRLGLSFCAGIMVWFWIMALMSIAPRVFGVDFGQNPLQYPWIVITVSTVVFVMALNLFGVFEITLPGAAIDTMHGAAPKHGYGGAFAMGFLATLLGTACTAPFLGTAVAYTLTAPTLAVFVVFTAIGVGMSAPYVAFSANPKLMKYIPRPGPWMVTFKQAMGFGLVGTAIWLLWVLGGQLGGNAIIAVLCFWACVSVGAWMIGKLTPLSKRATQYWVWGGAVALAMAGVRLGYAMYEPERRGPITTVINTAAIAESVRTADWDNGIPWQHWAPDIGPTLAAAGYPVYVDYTARWCGNCLANKNTVLERQAVRDKMRELGVIPIEADYTSQSDAIKAELLKFGRNTVPLNLIYAPFKPDAPTVLPPLLLSTSVVINPLEAGGPAQVGAATASAQKGVEATP